MVISTRSDPTIGRFISSSCKGNTKNYHYKVNIYKTLGTGRAQKKSHRGKIESIEKNRDIENGETVLILFCINSEKDVNFVSRSI